MTNLEVITMKHDYPHNFWLILLVVLAAVCALELPASAITLRADSTTKTLADGSVITVWGFADDTAGAGTGTVTVPGPQLNIFPGATLSITLNNRLPVPVSLVIPGLPVTPNLLTAPAASDSLHYDSAVPPNTPVPSNPYFAPNGTNIQPKNRVLSLTGLVAPAGGSASYSINITGRQGTYIYESGTQQAVQIPMGLYGALVIGPGAAGQAYPPTATNANTAYDQDQVVLFSEILARYDWTLNPPRFVTFNEDVVKAANALTPGSNLTMTRMLDYEPLYYLINGKGYPDTITPPANAVAGTPASLPGMYAPMGKKTLLRLINAGQQNRVPTIQGTYLDNIDPTLAKPHALYPQAIAEDGRLYNYAKQEFAPILPAGKSMDVMLDLTLAKTAGYYTLYDRRLTLANAGVFPGGMLTFLASWDPATQNCSPFKGDMNNDGQVNVLDALLVLKLVVANGYDPRGDVTTNIPNFPYVNGLPCGKGTGPLTISDALAILNKAVGMNPY
jgi:FtsP/CotA-like multicopper oxidase with cupredoxin domain